jgi:hypothetical protein
MKDGIVFYVGIYVLALMLKYIIGKLNAYFGKKGKEIHHEKYPRRRAFYRTSDKICTAYFLCRFGVLNF